MQLVEMAGWLGLKRQPAEHLSKMKSPQLWEHNKTCCSADTDVMPVLTLKRRRVLSAPWGRQNPELHVVHTVGESMVLQPGSCPEKLRQSHESHGTAPFHTA